MEVVQALVAGVVIVTSGLWWAEHLWEPLAHRLLSTERPWLNAVVVFAVGSGLSLGGVTAVWAFWAAT